MKYCTQFEKYIWSLFSENDFLIWVPDKEYIKVISFFKCLECPGSLEHRLYDLTVWQCRRSSLTLMCGKDVSSNSGTRLLLLGVTKAKLLSLGGGAQKIENAAGQGRLVTSHCLSSFSGKTSDLTGPARSPPTPDHCGPSHPSPQLFTTWLTKHSLITRGFGLHGGLNENGPYMLMSEHLVPCCWNCLGRTRKCGPVGGGVSLGWASGFGKTGTIPGLFCCLLLSDQAVNSPLLENSCCRVFVPSMDSNPLISPIKCNRGVFHSKPKCN